MVIEESIPEELASTKLLQEVAHTTNMVTEPNILDQPQSDNVLIEQVQLEQTHPIEVLYFILV